MRRVMVASFAVGFPLLACAVPRSSAPRSTRPDLVASFDAAPHSLASAEPDAGVPCFAEGVVLEVARHVEVECYPSQSCNAPLRFHVVSCSHEALSFATFELVGPRRSSKVVSWELEDPVVLRHGTRSRTVEVFAPFLGDTKLRVTLAGPSGPRVLEAEISFVDVRYEAEREACSRSGGDWLQQGMLPPERCVEVMHDEGRRCTDGRDCAGFCELTKRTQLTRSTSRVEGRCTRHRTRFGCRTFIGTTNGGIVPSASLFARTCTD